MYTSVLYRHVEAGFEAFPAENYVDYMTNVMPVPESHLFFLPAFGKTIVCEIIGDDGKHSHRWSLREYAHLPTDATPLKIETEEINRVLSALTSRSEPTECEVCEKTFGAVF